MKLTKKFIVITTMAIAGFSMQILAIEKPQKLSTPAIKGKSEGAQQVMLKDVMQGLLADVQLMNTGTMFPS